MTMHFGEYLTSDELRLLTHRGSAYKQVEVLVKLGVSFQLDQYACPLVRYDDAKQYFLLLGIPLPRGLPNSA